MTLLTSPAFLSLLSGVLIHYSIWGFCSSYYKFSGITFASLPRARTHALSHFIFVSATAAPPTTHSLPALHTHTHTHTCQCLHVGALLPHHTLTHTHIYCTAHTHCTLHTLPAPPARTHFPTHTPLHTCCCVSHFQCLISLFPSTTAFYSSFLPSHLIISSLWFSDGTRAGRRHVLHAAACCLPAFPTWQQHAKLPSCSCVCMCVFIFPCACVQCVYKEEKELEKARLSLSVSLPHTPHPAPTFLCMRMAACTRLLFSPPNACPLLYFSSGGGGEDPSVLLHLTGENGDQSQWVGSRMEDGGGGADDQTIPPPPTTDMGLAKWHNEREA